jgi:hypothetical protein
MASFPAPYLEGRTLVRIAERGLFTTNSNLVQFVDENLKESFPLCSNYQSGETASVLYNAQWAIPYEANGFLLIDQTASYNLFVAAPYQRFELNPQNIQRVVTGYTVNEG